MNLMDEVEEIEFNKEQESVLTDFGNQLINV